MPFGTVVDVEARRRPAQALDPLTRSFLRDVAAISGTALLLFLLAINLPVGEWLKLVAQNHTYRLDEFIFVFVLLSFVLPVFTVRRWRDLRRESRARLLAIRELEHTARTTERLAELTSLLHASMTLEEASRIVSHYAEQLFPGRSGALYVFRSSRNLLELAAQWGDAADHQTSFIPDDCWALRQGQLYQSDETRASLKCTHAGASPSYVCLPMMAHGEVLALLHVHESTTVLDEAPHVDLRTFAERIALAFSNLKLREALRHQSVRDPLTGLFNRRYMEETLAIEIERARRQQAPFSVAMLDLDHFKRFNDTHGHEAGDAVLQTIGRFLQRQLRGGDVVCRYGGEEFTLILPGASLDQARIRATELCEAIRLLHVDFRGEQLGPLTLSIGVAAFPDHGDRVEQVIEMADAALYQAKRDGRDRVGLAKAWTHSTPAPV